MKYTIYINEAKFTADEATVDEVIAAIEAADFIFDHKTQGFVSPGFYKAPLPTPTQVQAQ